MVAVGAAVSLGAEVVEDGVATVAFSGAGARSLAALRVVLADFVTGVVEVDACGEAFGLEGALSAGFFGSVFDLAGVGSRCVDSASTVGVEAALPTSAGVAAVVLAWATRASGRTAFAVALDSVVCAGVEDDVARSSTIAPPITVTTIAPIATPK